MIGLLIVLTFTPCVVVSKSPKELRPKSGPLDKQLDYGMEGTLRVLQEAGVGLNFCEAHLYPESTDLVDEAGHRRAALLSEIGELEGGLNTFSALQAEACGKTVPPTVACCNSAWADAASGNAAQALQTLDLFCFPRSAIVNSYADPCDAIEVHASTCFQYLYQMQKSAPNPDVEQRVWGVLSEYEAKCGS